MKRRRNWQETALETALGHTAIRSSAETDMRLDMYLAPQVNNEVDVTRLDARGVERVDIRRVDATSIDAKNVARSGDASRSAQQKVLGVSQLSSRSGLVGAMLALLFGLIPAQVLAVKPAEEVVPQAESELPVSRPISYVNATNQELDALGARWGYLSAPERRALLAEVRRRMAQNNGVSGNTGKVRIQATRQFGVVKRPDGTTVRVERRIIRMIPVDQGYGTGFEQRAARDDGSLPATSQEAQRRALEQEEKLNPDPRKSPSTSRGVMPASSSTTVPELPDASPVSR